MEAQPLEVEDYSGGMTDNYVAGPVNRFQRADNLLLVDHGTLGKLLTRPGSEIYEDEDDQLPTGSQRVGTMHYFKPASKLLAHSGRAFYYLNGSNDWTELVGPVTSNKVFPSTVDTTNFVSLTTWNNHLIVTSSGYTNPAKIYVDGSNNIQLRTAGLPDLASNPTITPGANTGKTFLYRFIYYYTYTVGTVVFEDFGPTTEVSVSNADAPQTNANAISAIPVLANGTTTNWDTSTIKVKIYRTVNAGSVFYYVSEVTNGTTTYNDNTSDATLITHVRIYTEGGVEDNDQPPLCKFVHVTEDNVGIYANIKEGSQLFTNRIRFSIPGDIDSCPADFYEEVDEEITGLSSFRSRTIVLCKSSVWRFEGYFDVQGRGGVSKAKISDTAGCVSGQSVVQTLDGVFWAGEDGFYYTDGFNVQKISEELNETYKDLVESSTKRGRIVGKYDKLNRRIWWGATVGGDSDNNSCFICHLKWGIKRDMPFTTASNGADFAPTALEFEGNDLLRGDTRGYIFRHLDTLYTDPLVDTTEDASDWGYKTIIWDYKSCAMNFGTNAVRKLVTRIVSVLNNVTNVSVQINSINDDGRKTSELKPIRFRGNVIWGDADIIWGDAALAWDFEGLIIEQRRMAAAKSLRCNYKQIQFTNAYVPIVNSDIIGLCSIDATASTANLDTGGAEWPTKSIGYFIAFEDDGYEREYEVIAVSGDTVEFLDPENAAITTIGSKWILRGYPKGEVMNLLSYTLSYQLFGKTHDVFNRGEMGEVGGVD